MHLELSPMEESDLDAYLEVAWLAFKDEFMGLMYPNGFTNAAKAFVKQRTLDDWRKYPDRIRAMKVIDTDLPDDRPHGKIVGAAMWKFFSKDRTEEELRAEEKEGEKRGLPPDCNPALAEEFYGNLAKCKREIMGGKAYVLLNILATLPEYHRRGIGGMHMRWGLEQADRLGLPSYLEATPMGRPLYTKLGYEMVRDFEFDARKYGCDHDIPHVCMLRPAKAMNGRP
ncbi:hypothetical protein LTR37_009016 [Vermiconidia calcicola]|uniref:Uncharacterized protein n=1 Tax=Vermiconidia calcicola TaxID=1690605 RepID=A0ACC3N8V4_9PEZI|nr:hypothetical protein LTR37_009016 [Vermiconidia calcicola]